MNITQLPCPRCGRQLPIRQALDCDCGAPLRLYSRDDRDDAFGQPLTSMWYEVEVNDGRNGGQIIVGIMVTATIAFILWLSLLVIFLL